MTSLNLHNYEQVALIAVDVQNDFCPGGSLGVNEGDLVVPALNRSIQALRQLNIAYWQDPSARMPRANVIATRDWHPAQTNHFSEDPNFVTTWPVHCVADTPGARFHPGLDLRRATVVQKGTKKDEAAYSGFEGRSVDTNLSIDEILGTRPENTALFIGGLATDYCVYATATSAIARGYNTFIITDAIKGVADETTRLALAELHDHARFIHSEEIQNAVERAL